MARNRVVLVSWGGNTVFSRTFPGDRYLAAGEGASADIPLPGTSFQIPPGYTGAFATGSFLIEVATTGDEDELRAPRWRPGVNGWSMFSAGAHVALLLAIACLLYT